MVEPEMAYATLDDAIELAEALITAVVSRALETRSPELETLKRDREPLEAVRAPFPRITYDEALRVLQDHGRPRRVRR